MPGPRPDAEIETIDRAGFADAVTVLCRAFFDYPAMRFFLATAGGRYADHLERLMGFFVEVRLLRDDPLLGMRVGGELAAVACLVAPESTAPPALDEHRDRLWAELGADARRRYEEYGRATEEFAWPEPPHFHLSLLAVCPDHAGRGLARPLLDRTHRLSASHAGSCGVSLTTESRDNVSLYGHFGYRQVGHARLPGPASSSHQLETWGLFREDRRPDG